MQVVDGVAPVILDVPAEGGKAHADVEPRQRHPTDVGGDVSQHRRVHHCQVVEVPATFEVFLPGEHTNQNHSRRETQPSSRVFSKSYLIWRGNLKFPVGNGESTPKLLRGDIGSIFHSDVLLDGSNQTPELFLHQLCGYHLEG